MQNSADSLNEGISPRWYTTEQVAVMLGYGLTKTKHLILSGQIRSVKDGGNQIEYQDEDPRILGLYEQECAKNGVSSRMHEFVGARDKVPA